MTSTLWTVVGLVLLGLVGLAVLVPVVLRAVGRCEQAVGLLRAALLPRVATLRALAAARPRRRSATPPPADDRFTSPATLAA